MQWLERWTHCTETTHILLPLSQRLAGTLDPEKPEVQEVWDTLDIIKTDGHMERLVGKHQLQ